MGTVRVYLGLGSNVGDAVSTLAWAVERLGRVEGLRVRAVSPLYVTLPWGVADQPDFRNAVVAADLTTGQGASVADSALGLLAALKVIEREAGRRDGPRWGPRELDVDILLFGRHRIQVERQPEARSVDAEEDPVRGARLLEVPHRDLAERLFVLAPLADLAPRLVPPGWRETVERRRRVVAAKEPPDVVRPLLLWSGSHAGPGDGRGWVEVESEADHAGTLRWRDPWEDEHMAPATDERQEDRQR